MGQVVSGTDRDRGRGRPRPLGRGGAQISELVAQGQSNKQLAATLFLSERTAEKHLSRAFTKLGLRSRGELAAAFARRQGPHEDGRLRAHLLDLLAARTVPGAGMHGQPRPGDRGEQSVTV
jgi:DNA-binding CsgD family transcriptional regulator